MNNLMCAGHTTCPGCPASLSVRNILEASGQNTVLSIATSCLEVTTLCYPTTSYKVPVIHTAFECAAATASGIEAAYKKLGKKANIIAIAGDGGTYDIGLQALSGMVDRGHNILYICYDNEAYSNTGIQRSSATPYGAWTTTSPSGAVSIGNTRNKKPIAEMMAAQGAKYVATSSIAYPKDIQRKVKKALKIKGPKFLLIHGPCPISWKYDESQTINIAKLAVETGTWVMYEIEDGKLKINMEPKETPVSQYLKPQGRFKHLKDEDIEKIQKQVNKDWEKYKNLQDCGAKL